MSCLSLKKPKGQAAQAAIMNSRYLPTDLGACVYMEAYLC